MHGPSKEPQLFAFSSCEARRDDPRLKTCWLAANQSLTQQREAMTVDGYCFGCRNVMPFAVLRGRDGTIETREGYVCPGCGMLARVRACLGALDALAPHPRSIYVTEQSTRTYAWMQANYPTLCGSEFAPDAKHRRQLAAKLASMGGHGEIEHQDITALSFAEGRFSAALSFDVLEHVPDYRAALRELARVLQPDGILIATFPFTDQEKTLVRASLAPDGEIVHHLPAEYHGDPIGGPILCYYHFGWDILDAAREAGFAETQMAMAWAPEQAILYGHWMLVARKTGE